MSYSKWLIVALVVILATSSATAEWPVSKSGCPEKCGDITIPYPFGIGGGCSYHRNFSITCNQTVNPPFPIPIYGKSLEVLNISFLDGEILMSNYVARYCYDSSGKMLYSTIVYAIVSKFTVSSARNILVATGCDTYAWFTGKRSLNRTYQTGCMTKCSSLEEITDGACSGTGCCQTQLPDGIHRINIEAGSFSNYTKTAKEFTRCTSAFMVAKDSFKFTLANLTTRYDQLPETLPAVYDWTIGDETCAVAQAKGDCLCCDSQGSKCVDHLELGGYRCSCSAGYSGNPYLPHGCQDINECSAENVNNCKEPATCVNTEGSYYCHCPEGFRGKGTTPDPCVPPLIHSRAVKIILSVGGSVILLLLLGFLLYWYHGKKQVIRMRDTFFRQNGGLILYQRLSRPDTSVDVVKIFTVEDLKKATDNYSDNNIIGRGGFGVVYKGKLLNNQIVAIKKSLKVDSSQIEQFINEVLVLSQVNNRNVVKLLGCCLETEVPLLVYEFIGNGTLHDHLHGETRASLLPWDVRLRIATEVAEVLAYLHTTVSTPIIHRDVKSMNILLDENYVAKVSDFGASKLVPMDHDQLATMVLGTHGYLDPEYMQTSELNEKSDVYSFGVVLVELLTRRKAFCFERPENERCLAMHFLVRYKEQRVSEIIDEKITSHGASDQLVEQLSEVAILARRCLEVKGDDRPSMKEVAMELERVRQKHGHPWSSNVGSFEEERRHLLSKTEDAGAYYGENTLEISNSQSCVVHLVPSGNGR